MVVSAAYVFIRLLCRSASRWVLIAACLWVSETRAQDPAQPSSPDALAAFSTAANFQNNQAFDLAAESWQEFLKTHASDPKAIDARYNLGVCYMQLKQLEKARERLQSVVTSKQPFDRREEAYLNLGWTIYSLALENRPELFPEADRAFASLLKEFPQGEKRDQALFFRGESLYLQENREESAKAYRQLIEQFPESPLRADAQYALGVTYEELGQFAEAGETYDQFLKQFADNELVNEVKMRKAETVLRAGDLAAAEARFAEIARLPNFASADHALYRQAYAVARQERFQDAGNLFAQLTRDFPKSTYVPDAVMAAARSYFRANQLDLATEWFDKVLEGQGPDAVEAAHWSARVQLKREKPEEALKLVEAHLPKATGHPFEMNLRMDQADALYELPSKRSASVALYVKIATDQPQHDLAPQAIYNAAYGAMELKEYEDGLKLTGRFLKQYPDHRLVADVKNVAAECHLQLGQNDAAARVFAELAEGSSERQEESQWRIREALALFAQGKYAESLDRIKAKLPTLTKPEEQAEAFYLAGMNYFALGKFAEAEVAFKKSLQSQSNWRQADETLLQLSRAQRKQMKLDDARETISHLIREFPDSPVLDQAQFRLAEYAYATGDYDKAIAEYSVVIDQFPKSNFVPYAQYGRGWSHLRSGNYDQAEVSFSALIDGYATHPLMPQAVYARGMSRQQDGKFKQGLVDIDRFLDLKQDRKERSDALYVRGLCQAGEKQFDQAVATFQSILREDENYAGLDKVLYELAWAFKSLGNDQEATAAFTRLADTHPDSNLAAESFYHVGEDAYAQQDFERAAKAYGSARDRVQKNPELGEKIRYKLGWSHYQRDEFEQALGVFSEQASLYPQGALLGDALFMQGECHFHDEHYQQALAAYTAAAAQSLSSDAIKTLTHLHAGQSAGQLAKWKESLGWLEKIASEQPKSPYLPQIQYEMAVAQQNLGNNDVALQLFGTVVDHSSGEAKARAGFMIGELHYAQKNYLDAIREFRKVMFGFDQDVSDQVRYWQAKAGFEAGQCAGILASQEDQPAEREQFVVLAKKFFEYVATQHPKSEEATAATAQLQKYRG